MKLCMTEPEFLEKIFAPKIAGEMGQKCFFFEFKENFGH